jgi:hypothetical protein
MGGKKYDTILMLEAGQKALVRIVGMLKGKKVVKEYIISSSKRKGTAQMN